MPLVRLRPAAETRDVESGTAAIRECWRNAAAATHAATHTGACARRSPRRPAPVRAHPQSRSGSGTFRRRTPAPRPSARPRVRAGTHMRKRVCRLTSQTDTDRTRAAGGRAQGARGTLPARRVAALEAHPPTQARRGHRWHRSPAPVRAAQPGSAVAGRRRARGRAGRSWRRGGPCRRGRRPAGQSRHRRTV